jgi:hypothetical protein
MSTITALFALAAETVEEEASKTPFYIAGGVAAGWAVLVSFLGITRENFPATKGAARGVMAISAVVVVAAMAAAVATG